MNQQRGFTIVEVMVALLVIGLTYAGVINAVGRFADERHAIKKRLPAYQVAWNQSVLEHLRLSGALADAFAADSGDEMLNGQQWRWTRKTSRLGTAFSLREIIVYSEGDERSIASMRSIHFD